MEAINNDLVLLLMMFLMFVLVLVLIDDDDKGKKVEVVKEAEKEPKQDVDSGLYKQVIDGQKEEIKRLERKILN